MELAENILGNNNVLMAIVIVMGVLMIVGAVTEILLDWKTGQKLNLFLSNGHHREDINGIENVKKEIEKREEEIKILKKDLDNRIDILTEALKEEGFGNAFKFSNERESRYNTIIKHRK